MKTKLNIWLIALLMAVGKAVTAAESPGDSSAALVNVVLVQVDTSAEAVAAKRFETGNWRFWDQAAPRLLARLEGDFGRTRATGPAGSEASLYGVRCAAASLDDTQNLKPLAEHLNGISKLTGRPGLLLVWMPNQGTVLLGSMASEDQQAGYSLATLARIPPTHAQQTLGLSTPAVAPPCVIVSDSVHETSPTRKTSLDLALRDGGLDSLSHAVVLSELRTAASESKSHSEPDLAPGAEIRMETLQKNVDRFNDITKTLYKVANLEMPTEMKVPLAFAAPVMGDLRSAGEGKFHPLSSQSLERVGKFGMGELPKVIAVLETQGRLPSGYLAKVTPFLAGAPDIVAGAASQAGRGAAAPSVTEVARYLDGVNKACWATVGALVAAPGGPAASARGASIASTSAGLAGDIARGWSYGAFEQAALDPVKKQMVSDFRTHVEAASGHGVQAKTFSEMFTPKEITRLGFAPKTVAELDASANWVNSYRSMPPRAEIQSAVAQDNANSVAAVPGELIVRHGKNLLGPPVLTAVSGGRIDDIPHVGVVVDPVKYGFSAVDLELQQVGDKTHGVIKPVAWNDAKQFQNAGYFSILEANIPIKYNGNITTFKGLPEPVKTDIRRQVQDRLALDAQSVRDVGEYKATTPGKSAQCFDYPLAVYDNVLKDVGVQVLRYEGPSAFVNWSPNKPINANDKSLTGGTLRDWFVVGEPLATAIHGDRTMTWTDPSKINDKLPRVGAPNLTDSIKPTATVPTYWTESGRAQSATEAGVLPAMVNGKQRALVVGTGPEVDILYKGTVSRLGEKNVLRIDAPFYERSPALEQKAIDFRADAILAVKQPGRIPESRAPDLKIEKPRPPEVSSLMKPSDIYPPGGPPPPPPPPAVIKRDDFFGGGGGSRFSPSGGGPGGAGGFSTPERYRLALMDPVPFRSDYNDRVTRALATPDLMTFKSAPTIPRPGGILFHPELEITADESGMTAAKADQAVAAVKGKAGGEFRYEGQAYIAVKAPGSAKFFQVMAGRFHLKHQDLSFRSTSGFDLVLGRYYDSGSAEVSALGKGWTFQPFSLRVGQTAKTGQATIAFGKRPVLLDNERGAEMAYQVEIPDDGSLTAPGELFLPQYRPVTSAYQPYLAAQTNGGYALTFAHGLRAAFNADGRLEWMGMSDSNRTDYVYESGHLVKVANSAGAILFKYDQAGLLQEAVAPDGNRVTYVVKASSGLAEVSGGVDGSFAFGYGDDGRVSTVEEVQSDGKRSLVTRNNYDSKGRMLSQQGPSGLRKFRYDDNIGVAVLTEPSGKEVSYYYDGKQQLLAYGSDRKDMTLFNYDVTGRIFQVATGELLNEPSGNERPKFKVTKMVTPEIPNPQRPAGSG